jgi:osmotically-inducible protein OsmY
MPQTESIDALLDELNGDEWIRQSGARIKVDISAGALTLAGEDVAMAAKRRAVEHARRFAGSRYHIVDHLRRMITKSLPDRELADTVAERLSQEPVFAEYSVDVETDDGSCFVLHDAGVGSHVITVSARDGAVTLAGSVGSLTHRRLAEVIAWWTGACASVTNLLDIMPPQDDADDELTDAVLMVLEKDPLVDASQLRVGTAGGIVHIEGLALTEAQRRSVIEDTWLVPGVADVVDRLDVQQP